MNFLEKFGITLSRNSSPALAQWQDMQEFLTQEVAMADPARDKTSSIPGAEMFDQPLLRSYGWFGLLYMLLVLGGFFGVTGYLLRKLKASRDAENSRGASKAGRSGGKKGR